jgi:diguanylate cyclase (GGDEF)-like protein
MAVVIALAAVWCAVAAALLRRGPAPDNPAADARRWFSWGCGVGAGTLVSGACAYEGLIQLHPGIRARGADWSNGVASLAALIGAGNAIAARLPATTTVLEQAWIVQLATWLLVLGTATTLLVLAGLGRRLGAWGAVACLWLLLALHLGAIASAFGHDAWLAAELAAGPVLPLGWASRAAAAILTTRHPKPGLIRVASTSSAAGGAAAIVGTSLAVVVADAVVAGGPTPITVIACAAAGALGVARLGSLVRELSRLAESRVEARTDVLTGLTNRRGFMEALADACEADEATGLAILDLDGFKEVNGTRGHTGGDLYIAALAARFREAVPPEVVLARIGGDEFAAVVRPADGLDAVAGALLATTHEPIQIHGRTVRLGASAGVATAGAGRLAAEELMRRADAAMYASKRSAGGLRPYDERLDATT